MRKHNVPVPVCNLITYRNMYRKLFAMMIPALMWGMTLPLSAQNILTTFLQTSSHASASGNKSTHFRKPACTTLAFLWKVR